ncbi:MAG: hypothetical protein HYT16_01705 [DPANN group archaeon]|nr:hypothetical protein [DPANN group archaeon]
MAKHCVVKRKGRIEKYDEKKVYGSVYAACFVVRLSKKACENVAKSVAGRITKWVKAESKKKICVNTSDIFRKTTTELKRHDKDAAFMYETHRDIS